MPRKVFFSSLKFSNNSRLWIEFVKYVYSEKKNISFTVVKL